LVFVKKTKECLGTIGEIIRKNKVKEVIERCNNA